MRIILTFDDEPSPIFPETLQMLASKNVPAVFFLIGNHMEYFPSSRSLIRDAVAAGRITVGNHSHTHKNFLSISDNDIRSELEMCERHIKAFTTGLPICRPPYGDGDSRTDRIVKSMGYRIMLWDADLAGCPTTFDWMHRDGGDIILLTHWWDASPQYVGWVIDESRKVGAEFVLPSNKLLA